ncbi:P-II family nitrogen regulator [Desulfonatronospira sp.]|uniref:P-II family nitrogen regulator n=1 Tax=Desulfonatronospira sp. TaxID=1962951 RepID=UPI0025C452DC|nr:P-II family nitrogen regulator [Desulfonatronospira sp.]
MPDSGYSLVVAIVNYGHSETVVDIAEKLGSSGGTVFFGRGSSHRTKVSILGVPVEPQKELVYIVVKRSKSSALIQKITEACNLNDPKGGLAFSLPLDEVAGLNEPD